MILDANQSVDFSNPTKIHGVVLRGRLFPREVPDGLLSEVEKPAAQR